MYNEFYESIRKTNGLKNGHETWINFSKKNI